MSKPSYFKLTRYFDFNSAYGQLFLLLFIPVTVMACVGSYLVLHDTSKTAAYEQQAMASSILMRYQPVINTMLSSLLQDEQFMNPTNFTNPTNSQHLPNLQIRQQSIAAMTTLQGMMNEEPHLQRMAIIDGSGQVMMSTGIDKDAPWHVGAPLIATNHTQVVGSATDASTAYGHLIGHYADTDYWLFIEMDNEPLYISWMQVLLAVVVTVLISTLFLLLALTIFAKRWIVPIYNMRLHLQQTTPDTLYKPINTQSSGELNLLQQDLVKTLRRLHSDFQELKTHAEQTENDLQLAFDEMEMRNINNRRARDMAVSASEAKSVFLANISHELRTPLNSIDGFINLLSRHGELTAEQDLYVQTIRKSSAHLLALVNDVLDFSKIEAGKLILDSHEFSLYAAIYDVMDMLSPLASEKGLSMAVLYYNDVPAKITGDALRVKQILTNLVSNAIKFTESGSVVVRVSLDDTEASANAKVIIAVEDTGRGINEAEQAQLFKNFSQGDPSITRQYGGTGLGLVISKQLTRLMGGEIGFYDNATQMIKQNNTNINQVPASNPGAKQGSTFWFTIPAHIDVIAAMEQDVHEVALPTLHRFCEPHPQSGYHTTQHPAGKQKTYQILVWLTDAITLRVLNAALAPLDIEVTQAHSFAGALDDLKEQGNGWDWVIIDGNDAQSDMTALLKQIRLHYQGKLAIYGYQVALDARIMTRYKAHGLYQPLDKRQLYTILDTKRTIKAPKSVSQWQGVTVLAVDDHPPNLLVLKALLNELGINVITANSGFDAIDIMSKQLLCDEDNPTDDLPQASPRIDLIFMDLQMPHMSGHEAAKQIRDIEHNIIQGGASTATQGTTAANMAARVDTNKQTSIYNTIPIIALSAHGLSDERDRLIASGINDYVGKPISQPQLLQILQRWLTNRQASQMLLENNTQTKALMTDNETRSHSPHANMGKPNEQQPNITADFGADAISPKAQHTDDNHNNNNGNNNNWQYFGTSNLGASPDDNHKRIQSLPIIDWEDALTRSANKPDLAAQLFVMLKDTLTDEVNELSDAWEAKDREQLAYIAHRILGASRYTGVPQLRAASQDLEDKCLLDVQRVTPVQFAMLKPYYDVLIMALQNLQTVELSDYPQMEQAVRVHLYSENDMTWKMI